MTLTPEQVSNLTLLADFMEGLVDPRFDMTRVNHSCGAPSCAFGWAQTIPEFISAGIKNTMHGSSNLFGDEACFELFRGSLCQEIHTPQQWAAHCRAFLKENGYEAKPDPFKTFMDRALAPVEESSKDSFDHIS